MEEGWGVGGVVNRTFHQHTAWGKKLINVFMFQPEQDKTNRNLQNNPPFSAPGIPGGDPGHCFFSSSRRKHKNLQTAKEFLDL